MKDFKFVLIILLIFFGVGIMSEINAYDYNDNNTGIMYQENENIVLNENNRYYDYDIDFNLNESYLHYSPVKKSGLLDNLDKDNSKNLAVPNLTGKDYLGNGVYRLYNDNGVIIDYNIYNGYFIVNGQATTTVLVGNYEQSFIKDFYNISGYSTLLFTYISGSGSIGFRLRDINQQNGLFISPNTTTNITDTYNYEIESENFLRVVTVLDRIFDNFTFKLQLEKGYTATPYEVPYIPPLQIAFNGSNQVEYINPFEEQIIKINDINNVDNIDFELLNTKNPVVFNWNITTNPNIPFIKFYNDETKLLYDFTDIDEINRIGNNLVASQSNIFPVINNVLDIVDMFYTGFQKLFNNNRVNTIIDFVKDTWPLLPPNLPLIPIIGGLFS